MGETQTVYNKNLIATLTSEQIDKLIKQYMCLVCAKGLVGGCPVKKFDSECITGYQKWLTLEADVSNWNNIRSVLGGEGCVFM